VVTTHNYQMDHVIAELLPVFEKLKGKPDGKLTRSDFEQHERLTEGNRLSPYYMYLPWRGCRRGTVWLSYCTSELVIVVRELS
jgi:hypothetical protein